MRTLKGQFVHMNKVVITGASGFLGSNLIKRLENREDVVVYALSSKKIESTSLNIKSVHKDIIDSRESKDLLKDSIVVNCAFPRNSTGTGMADGMSYITRLFLACKKYNARAIINVSSQSVYSQNREVPADENTEVCLESTYAVGKYSIELMLESLFEGTGIATTNIRMASLIGPHFDQRIVNRFVKQASRDGFLRVEVNDKHYGFLDVEDAVDGLLKLIMSGCKNWEKIYNLGGDRTYTLVEIADTVNDFFQRTFDKAITIEKVDGNGSYNSSINSEKFKKTFKFASSLSLYQSIERICKAQV